MLWYERTPNTCEAAANFLEYEIDRTRLAISTNALANWRLKRAAKANFFFLNFCEGDFFATVK